MRGIGLGSLFDLLFTFFLKKKVTKKSSPDSYRGGSTHEDSDS